MIGVGRRGPLGTEQAAASGVAAARRWGRFDFAALDGDAERPYWVAWSAVPGMGPASFLRLLTHFGSAAAAWHAGDAALAFLARPAESTGRALRSMRRRGAARVAAAIESATAAVNGRVVTALDREYPTALAGVEPRPPVLHVAGDPGALEVPGVAVVGTRRATGYGRAVATEIADELAAAGVTIVSGLAIGIDGDAHRAALAAGGRTIAVLPGPLDRIYPPSHRSLARNVAERGGALVSEMPVGSTIGRPDFARRNRLIAALAIGVVVVEAPDRSGALLTATAAIDLGRELYSVPGAIDSAASRGSNRLIADHLAEMVTSPAALLAQIRVRPGGRDPLTARLSDSEALVLGALLRQAGSVDELLDRTKLAPGPLAASLTLLESRGLATSYGGATFHPTLAARRLGQKA
jgi:DNA processing protein